MLGTADGEAEPVGRVVGIREGFTLPVGTLLGTREGAFDRFCSVGCTLPEGMFVGL